MNRPTFAVVIAVALAACSSDPWDAYPMHTMPDEQCDVGSSTHGTDLYVWKCVDGKRVAIAKYSAEMWSSPAERDTAACGSETDLERKLKPTAEQCRGPRSGRAWQIR
jgi:hypothetical protein